MTAIVSSTGPQSDFISEMQAEHIAAIRGAIRSKVNQIAKQTDRPHREVWNQLYDAFGAKGINAIQNAGKLPDLLNCCSRIWGNGNR